MLETEEGHVRSWERNGGCRELENAYRSGVYTSDNGVAVFALAHGIVIDAELLCHKMNDTPLLGAERA